MLGLPELVIMALIWPCIGLCVIAMAMVFRKAGYNGALSLLMLVPGVNLAALCILAFSKWPVLKRVEELELQVASQPPRLPNR